MAIRERPSCEGMVCREGEGAGIRKTKKAGISPSLCRNDRLMQDCLGPAHGMHKVRKPDPVRWDNPSEGVRLHLNNIKVLHRLM
jgi:hypothetical protein